VTENLGHEKNRVAARRESTNVCNGTRPKTMLTRKDAGTKRNFLKMQPRLQIGEKLCLVVPTFCAPVTVGCSTWDLSR